MTRPAPYDAVNAPLPDSLIRQILSCLAQGEDWIFLDTSQTREDENSSLIFLNPLEVLTFQADDRPEALFASLDERLKQGYFLAGWLAYEFGYLLEPALSACLPRLGKQPLARLGVYGPPYRLDHRSPGPASHLALPTTPPSDLGAYRVGNLRPSLSEAEYQVQIDRIKGYIAAGDTYQVNYTLKLLFDFAGRPEAMYADLRRNQPVSYGAILKLGGEHILSLSPELFFRKTGATITARPMKGTIARGPTPEEDRRLADRLAHDPKNRSENVMIVDLLRNDLGRLGLPGGVRVESLFDIETYATLHQMTSTISCPLKPHTRLRELFTALFPCGSVTGAPKVRTMEIIRELEDQPRGVYTGAIGYLAPDGGAVFNVPIRTVRITGKQGEMGIGSGIVSDSEPSSEWRECLLKGRFLTHPLPDFQLIETMLWRPGEGFWLLDLHLARLADSAVYFDFPCRPSEIERRLAELAAGWRRDYRRVRLLLHRDGRIDLSAAPCPAPAHLDLPPAAGRPGEGPRPRIMLSELATDSRSPFLYHKTTLREPYDRERAQAVGLGFFDAVFINERGEVTEGGIGNLLLRKDGRFLTTPVSCGLLAGVCRRHLLTLHPESIREQTLLPGDLQAADTLYLINSVRGVVEVGM